MTTASRRVGRLLTLLGCAALPAVCLASREVPVFTVDATAQTPAALAQAMRAALVRATGHSAAANDPQLAPLTANAAQYVQGYQQGPTGALQVTFKAGPLGQAIRAAGRNLWNADRPFTLVVLSAEPGQPPQASGAGAAQQAADAAAVQQAAQVRGLPISIVPLTVRGADGRVLPSPALLAIAHRFGAEQLLVGRDVTAPQTDASQGTAGAATAPAAPATPAADPAQAGAVQAAAPPADTWRWTLVTPFITRQFTGSVTAGINQTVALLAPPLQATADGGVVETPVRVLGLRTLDDYAQVETMLAAVPGVHESTVRQVAGTTAEFDLWARGGADGLRRMLALSPRLSAQTSDGGLTYRYVPPPPPPPAPPATASPTPGAAAPPAATAQPATNPSAAPSP